MGLNSSFPFVEWKPLRRLSSRRRQVLRVVHGLRMSQQEQVETREVQTGNKEKKKNHHEDSEHWKCRKAVRLNHWRFSRPDWIWP